MMLSFIILEIFLHRVNVSGFRGESVENTVVGHLRGIRSVFFLTQVFAGKDFWCAEYVDCNAKNAMMFLFTISDIFLHRVNVSGFGGESVENTIAGHLRGFRSVFFLTQTFPEKTFGVRNT
jgi:hypothetical protein